MIVVLGASGKTGRAVVEVIRHVSALRLVTRSATAQPNGLEVARARLSDEVELGRALKGAQALYAILPDDVRAEAFHASRRAMAETMTRAIRREGVGRVVLVSSAAAVLGEGGHGFGADLAYFERFSHDRARVDACRRLPARRPRLGENAGWRRPAIPTRRTQRLELLVSPQRLSNRGHAARQSDGRRT